MPLTTLADKFISWASSAIRANKATPKKSRHLAHKGRNKEKQTNEIKTAIPLLDCLDIQGKTITGDALLTQCELAKYIVEERKAHYHFTAKGNQKKLLKEVASFFENVAWAPDYTTQDKPNHGRNETRKIWVTTEINKYLNFPRVAQAFKVERITYRKKGKNSRVVAYGITSKTPQLATAEQILRDNRQHWCIENSCHYNLEVTYHARVQVLKMHQPRFFQKLASFAFFPLVGGSPGLLLFVDIFAGPNGGLLAGNSADKHHNSRPVPAAAPADIKTSATPSA